MRPELIHPMLVHFPIALLFTGTLLRFAAIWTRKKSTYSFLLPASWLILLLGVAAAWAAVMAGELAADIVAPTLANLKLLAKHELHAYLTANGFTIALLLDGARAFMLGKRGMKGWGIRKGLALVIGAVYLFSLANLVITGTYGAELVYQEGAAVLMKAPP